MPRYKEAKQNAGNPDCLAPNQFFSQQANGGSNSGKEPLCRMSDSDLWLVDSE
jgi:hypothetical protein